MWSWKNLISGTDSFVGFLIEHFWGCHISVEENRGTSETEVGVVDIFEENLERAFISNITIHNLKSSQNSVLIPNKILDIYGP